TWGWLGRVARSNRVPFSNTTTRTAAGCGNTELRTADSVLVFPGKMGRLGCADRYAMKWLQRCFAVVIFGALGWTIYGRVSTALAEREGKIQRGAPSVADRNAVERASPFACDGRT